LPPGGLGSANLRTGRNPPAGDDRGDRSVRAAPSVTCPSQRHAQGPYAGACPGGPGGFLVARRPAGFGPLPLVASVAAVGARRPPAHGLLGPPGGSHTVSPTQSEDAGGLRNSASRVYPASPHPATGSRNPCGLACMCAT